MKGKVKDIIDSGDVGKIIKTHSDKFGYGTYLIIKANSKYFADFMKFVKLPTCTVLDWDSMVNDDVLEIKSLPEIN